jgi:ComF family protein
LNDFTHIFFPHVCEGCGTDVLEHNSILCPECFLKLPDTGFIKKPNNPVEKIFYGRIKVEMAGSAFYFTKHSLLQHLVLQLKYHGNKDIGFYLGKLLGYQLAQTERFNDVDTIIPLPLNPRKERKRGYNQAAVIAEGIASVWYKPVLRDGIQRMVFTETQTRKDRVSRWQTMEGVFETTNDEVLTGRHILLIDDIVTTGATLEACGGKILQAYGTKLSIATVAYTI